MESKEMKRSIKKAQDLGYTVLDERPIMPEDGCIYVYRNDGVIPQYKFAFNAKHHKDT